MKRIYVGTVACNIVFTFVVIGYHVLKLTVLKGWA